MLEEGPRVVRLGVRAFADPFFHRLFLGLSLLLVPAGLWLWGQNAMIPAALLIGSALFMVLFALYSMGLEIEWRFTPERLTCTRKIWGLRLSRSVAPSQVQDWGNQLAYRSSDRPAEWSLSLRLKTATLPYPVVRLPGSFSREALMCLGAWLSVWSGRPFNRKLDNPDFSDLGGGI